VVEVSEKNMATYKQIQEFVKEKYDFVPKTCWIADVKEKSGSAPAPAPNRLTVDERQQPCPEDKQSAIEDALQHFGLIS